MLPCLVLVYIFEKVDLETRIQCRLVCKFWKSVIDDIVWQPSLMAVDITDSEISSDFRNLLTLQMVKNSKTIDRRIKQH